MEREIDEKIVEVKIIVVLGWVGWCELGVERKWKVLWLAVDGGNWSQIVSRWLTGYCPDLVWGGV